MAFIQIPYTRVNKRIHLFPKPQENMRLLPNMHLIMKAKLTTPPKLDCDACLVARVTWQKSWVVEVVDIVLL